MTPCSSNSLPPFKNLLKTHSLFAFKHLVAADNTCLKFTFWIDCSKITNVLKKLLKLSWNVKNESNYKALRNKLGAFFAGQNRGILE